MWRPEEVAAGRPAGGAALLGGALTLGAGGDAVADQSTLRVAPARFGAAAASRRGDRR